MQIMDELIHQFVSTLNRKKLVVIKYIAGKTFRELTDTTADVSEEFLKKHIIVAKVEGRPGCAPVEEYWYHHYLPEVEINHYDDLEKNGCIFLVRFYREEMNNTLTGMGARLNYESLVTVPESVFA